MTDTTNEQPIERVRRAALLEMERQDVSPMDPNGAWLAGMQVTDGFENTTAIEKQAGVREALEQHCVPGVTAQPAD